MQRKVIGALDLVNSVYSSMGSVGVACWVTTGIVPGVGAQVGEVGGGRC